MKKLFAACLSGVLLSGLLACQKQETASGTAPATTRPAAAHSPDAALKNAIHSLRNNDLLGLISSQVPAQELDRMRNDWKTKVASEALTDAKREEFAKNMAELTAPGAEEKIMAQIEPWLVKFEKETAPQMPMMVALGKGIAAQAITENKDLSEEQKQQARGNLDALGRWIESIQLTDRERVRKAVGHVVAAAREFNCKTLDEFYALSFDEAMMRLSPVLKAIKGVLATYGLDLDHALDSAQVEIATQEGDNAKVRVRYDFLSQPTSFEVDLTRMNGQWYNAKMVEKIKSSGTNATIAP